MGNAVSPWIPSHPQADSQARCRDTGTHHSFLLPFPLRSSLNILALEIWPSLTKDLELGVVTGRDWTHRFHPGEARCPKTPPEHKWWVFLYQNGYDSKFCQSKQVLPTFPVIFHQLGCFQSLGKERKRRNLRLEHRISPTGEQTVSSPCVVSPYRQRPRWGCDRCQHMTCRRGDRTGSTWLSCPARVSWFPLLASGPSSGKLHSSVTPLAEAGSLKDTCYYPAFTGDRSRGLCDSPEYYYGTPFTP